MELFFNQGGYKAVFAACMRIKLWQLNEEKMNYHKMVSFFNLIKHQMNYCVSSVI
jgi:hypothetical protein